MLTQERMTFAADVALLPLTLLINFSLCQYLTGRFFSRRAQPLTLLLLGCSFLGFAAMVPFSIPDQRTFVLLNDVSETASTLTFLIQIVIVGRDICKKVKIKSLVYISNTSLGIILVELALILLTMLKIVDDTLEMPWLDTVDKIAQGVSLWFVFVFRFYYVGLAQGGGVGGSLRALWRTRRLEIVLYLLFATNELPFAVLNATTAVIWDPVQAFWHRFTLLLCLLHTIHDKLRTASKDTRGRKTGASGGANSTASKAVSNRSVGPTRASIHKARRDSKTIQPRQRTSGSSWRLRMVTLKSTRSVIPNE